MATLTSEILDRVGLANDHPIRKRLKRKYGASCKVGPQMAYVLAGGSTGQGLGKLACLLDDENLAQYKSAVVQTRDRRDRAINIACLIRADTTWLAGDAFKWDKAEAKERALAQQKAARGMSAERYESHMSSVWMLYREEKGDAWDLHVAATSAGTRVCRAAIRAAKASYVLEAAAAWAVAYNATCVGREGGRPTR